jgi:hypothetical protein
MADALTRCFLKKKTIECVAEGSRSAWSPTSKELDLVWNGQNGYRKFSSSARELEIRGFKSFRERAPT